MTDATTPNGSRLRFDPTINMGHLLTVGSFAVLAIGGVFLGDARLRSLEQQVSELKGVIVENAKLGERIGDDRRRIDRLEAWREGLSGQPKATPWTPP